MLLRIVTDLWVGYKQACTQANDFTMYPLQSIYHRNNSVITINYNRHTTMMTDICISARLMHTTEEAKRKYCSFSF